MIQMTSLQRAVGAVIATLMFVAAGTNAEAAGLSGAIFTTDGAGLFVNGNVYDFDYDVYLNGGPKPNAPCTAAGLPDGHYYFQVTDPSGKVLLSTADGVTDREVVVFGGVIVHDPPDDTVGSHLFQKTDQCPGSWTVRLCPFDPSPNAGEEYKVWMTKVEDYDAALGSFGFVPSKSKTDNFKVTEHTACTPPGDGD